MTDSESTAFGAIADPTRRAILRILRKGPRTAGELAQEFTLSKPTLSHHFRVLERAGLVRSEKHGTRVVYAVQTGVLEDLAADLVELASGLRRRSKKEVLP
jgi:DNA-binding transcriptional ArsR family regulator